MEDKKEKKEKVIKPKPKKENPLLSKEMSAMNLAEILGLDRGSKLWVEKSFNHNDIKKVKEWAAIFKSNGVFEDEPSILK